MLLIIVGVLLITDYMTYLNVYVLRFTPNLVAADGFSELFV